MAASETRHATGHIEVKSYQPGAFDEQQGGPSLVQIEVAERFSGDIEGDGKVRFIQAARPDGSASFVGIERVRGSIHGKQGSFLLQDSGTLAGQEVKGSWFVVPGSGTDELHGLRGEGGFEAQLGQRASVWLDYGFE